MQMSNVLNLVCVDLLVLVQDLQCTAVRARTYGCRYVCKLHALRNIQAVTSTSATTPETHLPHNRTLFPNPCPVRRHG
jgi:hypothetical protein